MTTVWLLVGHVGAGQSTLIGVFSGQLKAEKARWEWRKDYNFTSVYSMVINSPGPI